MRTSLLRALNMSPIIVVAMSCSKQRPSPTAVSNPTSRQESQEETAPQADSGEQARVVETAEGGLSVVLLPNVPTTTFVPDPMFLSCKHPGVVPACKEAWCFIPTGCFIYGSPEGTPGRGAFTEEQGPVTITKPLLVSRTETTNSQWLAAGMEAPTSPLLCTQEDCPITDVDWYEAAEYANRRSLRHEPALQACYELRDCIKDKGLVTCKDYAVTEKCNGYRLPTNAEWQYSTKAGTTTHFYSGDLTHEDEDCYAEPKLEPIAWYCANSGNQLHPVAKKLANRWGLYDTLGNAYEWGAEASGFSPEFPALDPFRDSHPTEGRTWLGGAFLGTPSTVRAAKSPGLGHRGVGFTGFRLVRTISEAEAAKWQQLKPSEQLVP